jgi:hypothetical protein
VIWQKWLLQFFSLIFRQEAGRIKSTFFTMVNNTSSNGHYWLFDVKDSTFLAPLQGIRGAINHGDSVRVEIEEDKVQIGLRVGEGLSSWIVKPVGVETSRDIEFTASGAQQILFGIAKTLIFSSQKSLIRGAITVSLRALLHLVGRSIRGFPNLVSGKIQAACPLGEFCCEHFYWKNA